MIKTLRDYGARRFFTDIMYDIAGCFIFSVGLQCFNAPNQIAPGGVSGISVLANHLFGVPVSVTSFILNIPLLLLAWRFLGKRFTLFTLKSVAVLTVMLWVCETFLPQYQGDMILASLCGGVLSGFGISLVFARGSTTGGSDIASRLIQLLFPHISVGRLILVVDAFVLAGSAIVYGRLENPLYGMIAIFTSTSILDSILYGLDTGKVMMIISNAHDAIAAAINRELDRGCTILGARGSYTGEERPVLLCAVRKTQFHTVKQLVYRLDEKAFIVALEANEVIGEGFKAPAEKR